MKKIKNIVSIITMCFVFLVTAVGCSCGQKTVERLTVKSGLQYTYLKDSDVDFSDIKIEVTYNDGTKEEVGESDVTISDFNTSVEGSFQVTITYKEKSITVTLKVTSVLDELYEIATVEKGAAQLAYEANSKSGVDTSKESSFYVNRSEEEGVYVVGDDNPFLFNMNITLEDGSDYGKQVDRVKVVTDLYKKVGYDGTFTKLTSAQASEYVNMDENDASYDFKDAAIYDPDNNNIYFKLVATPYNLTEEQKEYESDYSVESMTFKVVDGYNVYNAKELGLLYNKKTPSVEDGAHNSAKVDPYSDWLSLLKNNGILDVQATEIPTYNGMILHNNILIKPTDIPETFMYEITSHKENSGTGEDTNELALYTDPSTGKKYALNDKLDDTSDVCDSATIYCHVVANEGEFNFYGNYFTLSAEELPTVETSILDNYGSTSPLFRFASSLAGQEGNHISSQNVYDTAATLADKTVVNIYNLDTIGNAARTDTENSENNADSAGMGGLIFVKSHGLTLNVKNTIIKNYLVSLYMENRFARINAEHVRVYDGYQSFIHSHQGGVMTIDKSEFKRAGGPIMILNVDNDITEMEYVSVTATDSTLESFVKGGEAWFNVYGLSGNVQEVKATDAILRGLYNSTFMDSKENINLITVLMSNEASNGKVYGPAKVVVNGNVLINTMPNDAEQNPLTHGLITGLVGAGAPAYQKAYVDQATSFQLTAIMGDNVGSDIGAIDLNQYMQDMGTGSVDPNMKTYLTIPTGEAANVYKASTTPGAEEYISGFFNLGAFGTLGLGMQYYPVPAPAQ